MNILISYADSIVNGHFRNRIKDAGHASADFPQLALVHLHAPSACDEKLHLNQLKDENFLGSVNIKLSR
jgi:hypothetical protein